ncbi:hypothetical protein P691DRAFT_692227 [Macrolepiota fuliginosa MF-IS2]|uniref:Uncharacterized protein n=1 Tax=Macrolepiota fuliginosa MF-IS2 TaxID=1400762 RepID=A0A9P5XPJ6_9AGAR|nr:hypothetical protein P691DRAFT_692227 [Macrolepiota fuliginosa MF-IS2]
MYSQKGVHNRIHTLRGEQFRHLQNLRGSRSHLTSTNIHTVPSLPFRLLSLADPSLNLTDRDNDTPPLQPKSASRPNEGQSQHDGTSFRPPAGPAPPRSWTLNAHKDIRENSTWRAEALSLIFSHLQSQSPPSHTTPTSDVEHRNTHNTVPSLSLLCLQLFLTTCTTSEFRDEVVPYVPPHLRKDLIRFTAVNSPLSSARLSALWEPVGHAHGEIIIVGPGAVLKDNYFIRSHTGHAGNIQFSTEDDADEAMTTQKPEESEEDREWDAEDTDVDKGTPLATLILLNTSLSSSTFFSLPPTITHLALINLSTPAPIHRLPNICPLLIVLDISYNSWLGANFSSGGEGQGAIGVLGEPRQPREPTIRAIVDLGRVDWQRWCHLKVLGFRGNYIPEDLAEKVNEGKWDDVDIVLHN